MRANDFVTCAFQGRYRAAKPLGLDPGSPGADLEAKKITFSCPIVGSLLRARGQIVCTTGRSLNGKPNP